MEQPSEPTYSIAAPATRNVRGARCPRSERQLSCFPILKPTNRDPRLAEEALRKLELQAARLNGTSIEEIDGGVLGVGLGNEVEQGT